MHASIYVYPSSYSTKCFGKIYMSKLLIFKLKMILLINAQSIPIFKLIFYSCTHFFMFPFTDSQNDIFIQKNLWKMRFI